MILSCLENLVEVAAKWDKDFGEKREIFKAQDAAVRQECEINQCSYT